MIKIEPYKRRINYYETDKMQVVHHSNYIRFLEECRMDFMRQIHMDYEMMESKGIMIPVLSVSCKYISPARFGELIYIVPRVESFRGVKFSMSYKIYSEDFSILHNEAYSEHCFVDFEFHPLRIKRDYPDIYEKMMDLVGEDLVKLPVE